MLRVPTASPLTEDTEADLHWVESPQIKLTEGASLWWNPLHLLACKRMVPRTKRVTPPSYPIRACLVPEDIWHHLCSRIPELPTANAQLQTLGISGHGRSGHAVPSTPFEYGMVYQPRWRSALMLTIYKLIKADDIPRNSIRGEWEAVTGPTIGSGGAYNN